MPNKATQPTPAAERMRRHRQRQRHGTRCFTLELLEEEIDALVRLGLLAAAERGNQTAVKRGFYKFLDRTLCPQT